MKLGNKIKELRKEHKITQEQLAENIGVSFQAVSKWENNISLPDISLLPVLASYFGVSIDELFDFNLKEVKKDIENIVEEALKFRECDPQKSREILNSGLEKYPENDILLNNLLYVLNYSENPDETIEIANKLIEKTNENSRKYDALRFLAYAYKVKGDLVSAEKAINEIPEITFNKLTEKAFLLNGEKKFTAAEKQKLISFENLLQMMCKIYEYYEEIKDFEKAVKEIETALKLISVADDKYFENYKSFFERQKERYVR